MNHLIQEFYSHQQEIINQMNSRHNFFKNKPVNITITESSTGRDREIKRVLFKGYHEENGFIHINWKNIKADGTESKLGGSQALFDTNSVIITIYNEN